jgi:hypothetical protein
VVDQVWRTMVRALRHVRAERLRPARRSPPIRNPVLPPSARRHVKEREKLGGRGW